MLSVVVPTLNEADNLKSLIPDVYKHLTGYDVEVLIVDGRSTDNTRQVVQEFAKTYPRLRFVLQSGKGFANALTDGILKAKGDFIVTMDAENHKPSEISLLLKKLDEGFDVVIGSRFLKGSKVDLKPERFISTRIANKIAEAALELKVKDTSSGFRAYRADCIKNAIKDGIKTEYFSCQVELLEKVNSIGGRLTEVPVHYIRRDRGESKYNIKPALKDASKLVEIARDKRLSQLNTMMNKPAKTKN
jgi:dolichol-phosphate mannosyltransferase